MGTKHTTSDGQVTYSGAAETSMLHRRRRELVSAVAHFLVDDQAMKGMLLGAGDPLAKEWAAVRAAAPIHGYPTLDEAKKSLGDFLGVNMEVESE